MILAASAWLAWGAALAQLPSAEPVEWQPAAAQLERGWRPTDLGDAQERAIGSDRELYIRIGGVEISSPWRFECAQGYRAGVPLYVHNRGVPEKVIEVGALCPPGVRFQGRLIPVRGQETGRDQPPVQCLLPGEQACQLRFKMDEDERHIPLVLNVRREFPLLGVTVPATEEGEALLQAWERLPAQLVHLDVAAGDLHTALRMAARNPAIVALGPLASLTTDGRPPDLTALERIVTDHAPHVDLWECLSLPAEASADRAFVMAALAGLSEARGIVRRLDADGVVTSPRFPASVHDVDSPAYALLDALLAAGMARHVQCLLVEAPRAGPAPSGLVEGKSRDPDPAWTEFDGRCAPTALDELTMKHGAALPILVCAAQPEPSGSPPADALALLRTVGLSMTTGLTGITFGATGDSAALPAEGPESDPLAFRALSAFTPELCGLVPAMEPPETDRSATAPGKPITHRAFVRGQEGVVLLWNNTGRPQKVSLRVRGLALEMHRASLLPMEPKLTRLYMQRPMIPRRKSEQEKPSMLERTRDPRDPGASRLRDRKLPPAEEDVLPLELQPFEFTAIALRFAGAHAGWLAEVRPE